MTYSDHWREHCLPRVVTKARHEAIAVFHHEIGLQGVHAQSYAEAEGATLRYAIEWGASRLSEPIWWDLEVYVSDLIIRTVNALMNGRTHVR